jgi:hypothetical protein
MAYGTNSNGGYSGTIIASSIRPADPLQTIATVFSNEIKGALHSYETIAERDSLIVERRDWGMLVVIYNDTTPANNKTYQLTYGYSSTTLTDNLNWKEFSGSGGSGGGEWLDSVLTVSFSEPVSPSNGDRYLVGRNQSDSITGTNWLPETPGFVAQWNSSISNWELTYPTNGMSVRVDDEDNAIYRYEGIYTSGGGWQKEKESQVRRLVATQTGGGSYSATSTSAFNQYDTDSLYIVKFTNTNVSASVSLNVNGLGHVLVKKTDGYILSDIYSGQIKTGYQYIVTYNGTFFELLDPSSSGGGTSSYDGSIKYNITPQDNIIVKPNTQYWVYGDLNIDGSIDNMGHVVVTNGSVTIGPTGSFNVGTWSNVYFAEINGLGQNNYVPRWTSPYMLTATSSIMDDGSAVTITGSTFSINSDIVIPSGASAGYVLTSDNSGVATWQPGGGGGGDISVVDFGTGITYSSVNNIIFRGGVVSVPVTPFTASAVQVTGAAPTVTVWIPAPNYVGYFSPSLPTGAYSRYVSTPSTNGYTSSVSNGYFGTGTWTPSITTTRSVTNLTTHTAFTESEFACYDLNTTLTFNLLNHDGSSLSSISNYVLNAVGSTTSNGITITVNSFSADGDRYKANVSGAIAVSTLFPNGGRFTWGVIHNNSGDGVGNSGTGVYAFTQSTPIFYDNDGVSSSANISGSVLYDEKTPTLKYYSGVAFYDTGSVFAMTASGINLLNDITIPTTKQVDFTPVSLGISILPGFADGSQAGVGSAITGWTLDWDKSGLTFSKDGSISTSGLYVPGFSTNNTISSSAGSYVTANLYDYGLADTDNSASKTILIDTLAASSVTYNNNPLDSENSRLSVSGVLAGNGSSAFNSNTSLATNTDELQYIFGRVIFPQTNFTSFFPLINISSSVNYSSLSAPPSKTFTVYTDLNNALTTSVTLSGYRWHVTSYTKGGGSFGNGTFFINSNFTEADLHYNGVLLSAGLTEDLVILIGIDSSGTSTNPDRFIFLSGDFNTYPGRDDSSNFHLNKSAASKDIKWTKGSGTPLVVKVWLFIGYKNTVSGKNLNMTNIALS